MAYLEQQQCLTAKNILTTILLNKDTSDNILDEYLVSYLKLKPELVTKYLEEHGLYHIYARNRDISTDYDHHVIVAIRTNLIKSFATELEAKNWILKSGSKTIEWLENIHEEYFVLSIIYDKNVKPYKDSDYYYNIAYKQNLTFAFSSDACDMLVEEMKYYQDDEDGDENYINPYLSLKDLTWVTFVNV